MIVRNPEEIETLRECGRRLALILNEVRSAVRPEISTKALDEIAERLIVEHGGEPVFKGYKALGARRAYPCSLCVSINDEVVHGIPSEGRILADGDVVGLDIGMRWPSDGGLITDAAVTVGVGKISGFASELITTTMTALEKGIAVLRPGMRLGDLGATIQAEIERKGFGVIRDLAGHGVGRKLHEEPFVPNWGRRGSGPFVHEGTVLAVEPMAAIGDWRVRLDPDEWTFRTADGSLSAHFEHTVLVYGGGAEVLTKI